MSMDEMLLNELYGSEETRQDEEIKQAQVELVEAVAAEAGVDLNELDDDELAKFAHYVLSDEDEVAYSDETQQDKLAEADMIGRQMAHSYMDELTQLTGETMYGNNMQTKIASALQDVADAWEWEKIAADGGTEAASEAAAEAAAAGDAVPPTATGDAPAADKPKANTPKKKLELLKMIGLEDAGQGYDAKRIGKLGLLGAGTAGLGYGAYRLMGGDKDEEKTASFNELIYDELEKVAFFGKEESRARRMGKRIGVIGQNESALRRAGRLGATAAGVGAVGYGGKKAYEHYRKRKQEKKASLLVHSGYDALALAELYEPEEFAKEAELRAAEILLANGIDPTDFSECYPESVKIASFPGVEYACDEYEAAALEEYNDMLDAAAMHIIDSL